MFDEIHQAKVAVKVICFNNNPIDCQMMQKEVIALSKLQHPNIVRLIDSFPNT